jgi:hypothetical protein
MHLVQQSREQASGDERGHQAGGESESGETHAVLQYQRQHMTSARAQRHPNADLARALGYEIRQYSVDSNCGKQQRQSRKQAQQHGEKFCARAFSAIT